MDFKSLDFLDQVFLSINFENEFMIITELFLNILTILLHYLIHTYVYLVA